MSIRWWLIAVGLHVLGATAGVSQTPVSIIDDTQENWRIAILDFYLTDRTPEFSYLQKIVPNLLQQQLKAIKTHHFDDERAIHFARYLQRQQEGELRRQLHTQIANRDTTLLREGTSLVAQPEAEIAKLQQQIIALQNIEPSQITIATPKTVELFRIQPPDQGGYVLPPALATLSRQNNADLIIGATISQQDEFLLVDAFYYSRVTDTTYSVETILAGQDELSYLVAELSDRLALVIRGSEWGTATIQGVTENTEIKLNGSVVGFGNIELPYLDIGTYVIEATPEIATTGETQEIEIRAGQVTEVQFTSAPPLSDTIRIESVPSGATIYVGSLWQGVTPLEITKPLTDQIMRLKKRNYFDAQEIINPDSPATIQLKLRPQLFDTDEWLYSRRDNFYSALTAFIISIPIPIVSYGIYENLVNYQNTNAFNSLSTTERTRLQGAASAAVATQYAGIFLSASLLVNSIIELVRYVDAADLYHRL